MEELEIKTKKENRDVFAWVERYGEIIDCHTHSSEGYLIGDWGLDGESSHSAIKKHLRILREFGEDVLLVFKEHKIELKCSDIPKIVKELRKTYKESPGLFGTRFYNNGELSEKKLNDFILTI